jgi:ActR/RegA family two-component response regulator
MYSSPVVLLQADSPLSSVLQRELENACGGVQRVRSVGQARQAIAHHRASHAVIDCEISSFREIADLTRDFPATAVICTHRLADELMWAEALNAGAVDIFSPTDARGIISALTRSSAIMGAIAA